MRSCGTFPCLRLDIENLLPIYIYIYIDSHRCSKGKIEELFY